MNALTLLALIALAIGVFVAYRIGLHKGQRGAITMNEPDVPPRLAFEATSVATEATSRDAGTTLADGNAAAPDDIERARLVGSHEAHSARMRAALDTAQAELVQLRALAAQRRSLYRELADAHAATARYRQIVIDIETNAPPPILDGPHAPDDLKLIVGVGPVLERMLQQLGVGTYRQIARWSERDIDEFDARLHEFPGRIRRDAWVVQARSLHQSKYGDDPRERG